MSVSFGFAKTRPAAPLKKSSIADSFAETAASKEEEEAGELVEEFDASKAAQKKKKDELVIPCKGNRPVLRQSEANKDEEKSVNGDDLNSQAAREVLADVERWSERREAGTEVANVVIPLSEQTDAGGKVDTDSQEESTLDDYEAVPVQGFGMGMLRGMGFKPGEGIGGFKKVDVKCLDPVIRPKGLGLGAARPGANTKNSQKNGENGDEPPPLKRGVKVQVVSGAHRDLYGQVEGMDEESARVFVRLAVGAKSATAVSVSEAAVRTVTEKEYSKYSKIINRELYDKYEEKQKERQAKWEETRGERDDNVSKAKKRRKRSPSPKIKDKKRREHKGYVRHQWVRPSLRVRFIDKKFAGGRYFNEKVIVDDVVSADSCTCRTAGGRYLDDVHPKQLETLVPKSEGDVVMILVGERKGQLAEMLRRDKAACLAAVRLLPDRDELLKLSFDDICEYTGDMLED